MDGGGEEVRAGGGGRAEELKWVEGRARKGCAWNMSPRAGLCWRRRGGGELVPPGGGEEAASLPPWRIMVTILSGVTILGVSLCESR